MMDKIIRSDKSHDDDWHCPVCGNAEWTFINSYEAICMGCKSVMLRTDVEQEEGNSLILAVMRIHEKPLGEKMLCPYCKGLRLKYVFEGKTLRTECECYQ